MNIAEVLGTRLLPRIRAWVRDDKTAETRSRSPKRRFNYVWATQARTLSVVNAAVGVILACNIVVLVWTGWAEGGTPKMEHKRAVIHAGFVERRNESSAGAAAQALHPGKTGGVNANVQRQPPVAELLSVTRVREPKARPEAPVIKWTPPVAQIYGIAQHGCRAQWNEFAARAQLGGWSAIRWDVAKTQSIRLAAPPLPLDPAIVSLARYARGRGTRAALRRQIAYLDAHRRAWAGVARARVAHALIMDAHLFPTLRTAEKLGAWLSDADSAAITQHARWHVMLLRALDTAQKRRTRRPVVNWVDGIRRADTAKGAGAYVVSQAGARMLLAHVRAYRGSLDGEFARLAREMNDNFIVLTPCEEVAGVCDELTQDITDERVMGKFRCVWRALEERKFVQHVLKLSKF